MTQVFSATTEATDENLLNPDFFAASGYPHGAWERLRREDPVHFVAEWAGDPYWAITRHADIIEISKNPGLFSSKGGYLLYPRGEQEKGTRNILDMDPPEHRVYRGFASKRFTPRALKTYEQPVDRIAGEILDGVTTGNETAEIDFVVDVAAKLPIWVVAEMLGVPSEDSHKILDWTNATFGSGDPEFAQGRSAEETRLSAIQEMFGYFQGLVQDRLSDPRDDISTDLANAKVDGEPIPDLERLSYFVTLLGAGNETVRNATSGGLLALIENPDQLERARREPELLDSMIEEILRYVSPVVHMCRMATRDTELGGKEIKAGQRLGMLYASANRDERVFDDPHTFRIDRDPNRHLAFGVGEHFCIGAHVARMELRSLFRQLIDRLEFVELAGPVERLRMNAVSGIKHLPIRYRLRAAS